MCDSMMFPATVDEFMEKYKVVDSEHVYSNGMEMVPIFRMKQWFEHEANHNAEISKKEIIHCKDCKWWDKSENSPYGYCMAMKHNYFSRNWEISIHRKYKGDFYCADAEREEE